jgi:hypothetical protein
MDVKLIYARNRRIPGRATGTAYFDLKWPSGRISKRDVQFGGLASAIKFLKHRLKEIPASERDSLSAELFAEIRKPVGSLGRVSLGSCVGERSLSELFKNAETAWTQLEHECDDQKVRIPDVIDP